MSDFTAKLDTRRDFMKFVVGSAALIPLASLNGCSEKPGTAISDRGPSDAALPKTASKAPASASKPASAASVVELPRLTENDPTASALGYRHDATSVDLVKYPRRAGTDGANQFCSNCSLFLGQEGMEWAGCSLFPGKGVNRNGWCSGWVAKTN